MAAKPDILQATESLVGVIDGVEIELQAGDLVASDDPAAKKWPDHFGPAKIRSFVRAKPDVELATAAPGEKRA